MKSFQHGPVDKRLVHKHSDQNVFVRDLRRAVPATLDKATVESLILPRLSPSEQDQFLGAYVRTTSADGTLGYSLSVVPRRMASRLFGVEQGTSPFTAAEKRTLERHYTPDATGEWHVRNQHMTEMDDVVLTHILENKRQAVGAEGLITLANLLEAVDELPKEQVFHAALHVSVTHPYYFEHPNEHVPGMMVLEAARQFAMACWHRFGGVPLQGYQFILNQLHAKFYDYVDLNYPATLTAEVRDLSQRTTGEWESASVIVTVGQGDGICAEVSLPAQVVSKRSFQRLRSGRSKTNPQHRFQPIANIHHRLSLWNTETRTYQDARLIDLSLEGLGAEVALEFEDHSSPSAWEAFLYFDDVGFIRVASALVWRRHDKGRLQLGFRFLEISPADRSHLLTVIRQYCQVHQGRERV